ncbi:MAG TPA: hypothetical protein VLB04_02160 [Methanotrichaceae archaeon]|nr:hypothetical protein [Methanotrichaceae archaeon]
MRLFKDVLHVMQTTFAIPEERARELLPRPFMPYAFFGRCLLQLGALKYRDLIFEGESLGPCTDVYIALGVRWKGKLHGFNVAFYNDSKRIVEVVNKNWFFGKELADIHWSVDEGRYHVQVNLQDQRILDYRVTIPSQQLVLPLPVLPKVERALTLSGGKVYAFDNIFCSNFGFYAWPEARARHGLDWFERINKTQLYSLIWFDDILRVADAEFTGEVGPVLIETPRSFGR